MKKALAAAIVGFGLSVGAAFMASPAMAEAPSPLDTQRTMHVQVTDREDSGKGTPTVWAKDSFGRDLTITFEGEVSQDAEVKTMAKVPDDLICDQVKENSLTWKYKMVGIDTGTFKTVSGSATGSPGAGAQLISGATGNFNGGFTATFEAPAFWCTFENPTGAEASSKSSSEYPALIFGDAKGVEMPAWEWTYTRCTNDKYKPESAEKWTNGAAGNKGDILGATCVEKAVVPSVTGSPTPPPSGSPLPTLPLTGSKGDTSWILAQWGGGLIGAAIIAFAIYWFTRRRNTFIAP